MVFPVFACCASPSVMVTVPVAIALLVVPEALPSIGFCALPAAEAMAVLARLPARFRLPASSVWAG